MNVNDLSAWLKLADQQNLFGTAYKDSAGMYDPSGQRLQWAARLAMNDPAERQNFFGFSQSPQSPGYVQPQQFAGARPQVDLRNNYFDNDPMRADTQNYLMQLLGNSRGGVR
jgi:hypothetical protein